MQSTVVNGVTLNFYEEGKGPPVIFVHESLNDARSWWIQVSDFQGNDYRGIALSRRNHYPNPWSEYPKDYTINTEAKDLAEFIQALNLGEPVHLVGSSYGAFICAIVARDNPALVRSLVLAEPPILSLISQEHKVYFDRQIFEARIESTLIPLLESGQIEEGIKQFVDSINGEGAFARLNSETKERMLQNGPSLKAEITNSNRDPFSKDAAQRIAAPTLLLRGEHSPIMYHIITQELLRSIPRARVATISHSSHLLHIHNPQEYDKTVLGFLKETR